MSVGLREEIYGSIRALSQASPAVVFNLCESLRSDNRFEALLPMLLEYEGLVYTGSPPPDAARGSAQGPGQEAAPRQRRADPAGRGSRPARHERRGPDLPPHRQAHPGGRLGGHRLLLGGAHARGARQPRALHPGPLPPARPRRGLRRGARDQRVACSNRSTADLPRSCRCTRSTSPRCPTTAPRSCRSRASGWKARWTIAAPGPSPAACPRRPRSGCGRWRWPPSPPSSCATTVGWTCGSPPTARPGSSTSIPTAICHGRAPAFPGPPRRWA